MLALPLIAAAAIGLSACSSQNPGNAVGDSSTTSAPTTTSSSAGGASTLASVDPCSLVTQDVISKSGLQAPTPANASGGRACRWNHPDDGATVDGYQVQIVIYDTAGMDQLNTSGGTVADYSTGKYQGKIYQETALNACLIALPTGSSSRIDLDVVSSLGIDQGCKLVKQLTPLVVANFPAGS
jgi:hypothetical protein